MKNNNTTYRPLTKFVSQLYFLYLGILPAAATLSVRAIFRHEYDDMTMLFLFMAGVAASGVYLAVTLAYTFLPSTLVGVLFLFLDGPIFALISLAGGENADLMAFIIDSFLIDGVAIFCAIAILSWTSNIPTQGQKIGSTIVMLICVSFTAVLFFPYLHTQIWGNWWRFTWLAIGLIEALYVNYGTLYKYNVMAPADLSGQAKANIPDDLHQAHHVLGDKLATGFIIIFVCSWIGVFFLSNLVYVERVFE